MAFERTIWHVDLKRLKENFCRLKSRVAPARSIAVVKADAYGVGLAPVARTLAPNADAFAVAELGEALTIADLGRPVLIFGSLFGDEIPESIAHNFWLPVGDLARAKLISQVAQKLNRVATVVAAVDSGMGRVGFSLAEAPDALAQLAALPGIKLQGLYSHFATAANPDDPHALRQLAQVTELIRRIAPISDCHIGASDAIANYSGACQPPFNWIRIGLAMYGMNPDFLPELGLEPVLSLHSRLLAVRELPAGASLGYSRTRILTSPTRVGTVSGGYAAGFPLALSNAGRVLVNGVSAPVLGRVSMDYTTVDLSAAPEAKVGDQVVLIGGQGKEFIYPREWAELKHTHDHDILCSISNRVKREYHE